MACLMQSGLFCLGQPLAIFPSFRGVDGWLQGVNHNIPKNLHYLLTACRLKGHPWIGAEDRSMLDVEGAELLLVGASRNDPAGTVRV